MYGKKADKRKMARSGSIGGALGGKSLKLFLLGMGLLNPVSLPECSVLRSRVAHPGSDSARVMVPSFGRRRSDPDPGENLRRYANGSVEQ